MEEYFVTQKAFKQLKTELEKLQTVKKWEIASWLKEASAQGDMIENAEYLEAKEAQTALENRINDLEEKIRKAKVIKRRKKDIVDIGSTVILAFGSNKKRKIKLVSPEESEAGEGKISNISPLGHALMGKKVKEEIEIVTPRGNRKYRITKII